ncbi:MAG: 3'-5' exonuclease [Bacteroidota bacterium]
MSIESIPKEISKEDLAKCPVDSFPGTIHLIDKPEQVAAAYEVLKKENLLGMDTETKPSFKKGVIHKVSLLQLSTTTDVFVFRLNRIGLPEELVKLLNNQRILKVGIALHDDIKDLKKLNAACRPQNTVDLNKMAQQLGFESIGAKKLSALVLGFTISKSEQTSNWEAENLTANQLKYAATDAWICNLIYTKLTA